MNRHSWFKLFVTTILLCGGGLAILAGLVSCENFLKAGQVKDEILEAIEIANSTPVTVNIIADEGSGTVTPSQLRMKRKEVFDILYNPADSWRFIKWEVFEKETGLLHPGAIEFEDETAPETKVQLRLKTDVNLVIHPKAVMVPDIVSVRPSSSNSNYANTPIVVQFNMPMEPDETVNSQFNFDNISITCNGVSIVNYFNSPTISKDKTIVTITPKATKLMEFIKSLNTTNIEVRVSFSDKIFVWQNDTQVFLEQNENSSFVIRYNTNIEYDPPEEQDFIVSNDEITLENITSLQAADKFLIQTSLTTNEQILQNRSDSSIYIYGEYTDLGSGIGSIVIEEKRTNGKDGFSVSEASYETIIDNSNYQDALFETINENTRFIIKYNMQNTNTGDHKDGAIRIDLTVYDNSGNKAPIKSFTVIKDSFIDLANVELYNFNKTGYPLTQEESEQGDYITSYNSDWQSYEPGRRSPFKEEFYEQELKTVKLQPLNRRVYADTVLPETDFTITVEYMGRSGLRTDYMTYDSNKKKWSLPLQVDDIENLELKLTVKDSFGFVQEKEFKFPPNPEIHVTYNQWNYPQGYMILNEGQAITAYSEFAFSGFEEGSTSENILTTPFFFYSTIELSENYLNSYIVPNGETNGVFYIYQNGSLWGNKCAQWFSYYRYEKDETIIPPTLSSAQKQRSDTEGNLDIVVNIPASTWDSNAYDSISVYCEFEDPEPYIGTLEGQLESLADKIRGLINKSETTITISVPLKNFNDASNKQWFILLRGIKDGKVSKISNHIRVKGLNNETDQVQRSLINYKPIIYTREDFYNEIIETKNKLDVDLEGLHHGSEGDNTIYYKKQLPIVCDYFYPLTIKLPYTQKCGYSQNYFPYDGDKVYVTINGVTSTYNFDDVAFMIKPDTGDEDDIYEQETHYQLVIPSTELCYDSNELSITVTTNCGTSATYNTKWERKYVPKFNNFPASSSSYIRSEKTDKNNSNYQNGEWNIIINNYNTTSNKWINNKKINTNPSYNSTQNDFYFTSITNSSLPSNSFIQVIAQAVVKHEDNSYWDSHYSDTVYHYTGTKSSGDETDFMIEQGGFWLIGSDQPVLVHTLVTKQGYDVCQSWDAATWERNHTVLSEKQLSFTSSNSGAKKYNPNVSSLNSGDCYVVIAHFADDHIEMSEVKQK